MLRRTARAQRRPRGGGATSRCQHAGLPRLELRGAHRGLGGLRLTPEGLLPRARGAGERIERVAGRSAAAPPPTRGGKAWGVTRSTPTPAPLTPTASIP